MLNERDWLANSQNAANLANWQNQFDNREKAATETTPKTPFVMNVAGNRLQLAVMRKYRLFQAFARVGELRYSTRKATFTDGSKGWLVTLESDTERKVWDATITYLKEHPEAIGHMRSGILVACDITNHANHPYNVRRNFELTD